MQPTTYVLDGNLADLGTSALVRRLAGVSVTESDVTRIATALGLKGTPTRTDAAYEVQDTVYEVRDGAAMLTVNTGGAVTSIYYSNTNGATSGGSDGSVGSGTTDGSSGDGNPPSDVAEVPPSAPPVSEPAADIKPFDPPINVVTTTLPPPVDVPSADEATAIAASLLDRFGVLKGQQWAHDVTAADVSVSSCMPERACGPEPEQQVRARTVTYALLLDGTRVPGVDWSVTIGENRQVESVYGTWFEVENAGTYPLRSTADVFADLQNGREQRVGPQIMAAEGGPMLDSGMATETTVETAPQPTSDTVTTPDTVPPPDTVTTPDTAPAPDKVPPLEVRVTGVSLGLARWDGTENGKAVVYVVPTYRFRARIADGDPYDVEVLALDPGSFNVSNEIAPAQSKGRDTGAGSGSPAVEKVPAPAPSYKPRPR